MAKSDLLSYHAGFVQDRNRFLVTAVIDDLADAGEPDSMLLRWDRPGARWTSIDLDWTATLPCALGGTVLVTGPVGRVVVEDSSGVVTQETIDATGDGPPDVGVIRGLRVISSQPYVVGMGRQVYRREGPDDWARFDAGVRQPLDPAAPVAGFNAIDGVNEADLYAVGYTGEIWHRHGGGWRQVLSPTNVIMNDVKVVQRDLVFVCGQKGILFRGSGDAWEMVEHDATDEQLWSMEWYREALYLAGSGALYRFLADGTLEPVNVGLEEVTSFGQLHANDGLLLSVGRKDVCFTEDGHTWQSITL
ncbi:MAG: hypothetical protein J5I81_13650 [Nitrococcus mobilis]|nr:hypothetical protein [Nitrococcus mobilis]